MTVPQTGGSVVTLDRQTLNRATLERQLLFHRSERSPLQAVEHLVGLQAQEPLEPYVGLWSRLRHFTPQDLVALLEQRLVVRTLLMRRTLHLVTGPDCLALRPVHQAMMVARTRGTLGRRLPGVDLGDLGAAGAQLFEQRPQTLTEVARAVANRWPQAAPRDLGDALSSVVPLVQTPPRGVWGARAPARNTTIRAWLGREPAESPGTIEQLVLRYLRAYGPASTADLRSWCGLTGLPEVIRRLRPELRSYRDERGRELLDVDLPLPGGDATAPVRFLPAFDNAVLGYADRSRLIDDEHRGLSVAGARFVLVDGRVAATWTAFPATASRVQVRVDPLRPLGDADRDEVGAEAHRLATFLGDDQPGSVVISR